MNKKLFLGMFAAAGMLLATSCSNDELDVVQSGNEAQVTFSLVAEGGIATRAISDGKTANKLVYAVFDSEGKPLSVFDVDDDDTYEHQKTETINDIVTTPHKVTITLAKGQTYQVAFWAQNEACKAYDTSDLKNVEVNYAGVNNDETRDAFFKTETITVKGDEERIIELRRPFAQINVGVTKADWDAAVASGVTVSESKVFIKNAATSINLLDGTVSGEQAVEYAFAAIPTDPATLKVDVDRDGAIQDDEEYKYLSMSYILTSAEKTTLESDGLEFTFKTNGNDIVFDEGLHQVPVQRNWRTNILGKLLTGDITFEVVIDPDYEDDYNILHPDNNSVVSVTSADEITTAIKNATSDITLYFANDITGNVNVEQKKDIDVIVNGNNYEFDGVITLKSTCGQSGASLKIQNLNFVTTSTTEHDFIYSNDRNSNTHKLTISNCTFTGQGSGDIVALRIRHGKDITFENCKATGLHSLMWATGTRNIKVSGVELTDCKNGVHFGTATGHVIENSTIKTIGEYGYGVRVDAAAAEPQASLTVRNCTLEGDAPVLVRKSIASTEYALNFEGKNTLITSKAYHIITTADDYEEGTELTVPAGTVNITGANGYNVYPMANTSEMNASSDAQLSSVIAAGATTVNLTEGNYTLPPVNNKNITITGTEDVIITVNQPNYSGADLTLSGVTVKGSGYATGVQHVNTVTYKDVKIVGDMCLYGEEVKFDNCTFELNNQYIWTYGAKKVSFDKCRFNTTGKAILIYNEGANANSNVTVTDCTFNATAGAKASAIANQNCAAIEIDSTYGDSFTLTTSGNSINKDYFSGTWRIKACQAEVTVNGTEYSTIAIDGQTMTIDPDKNVTVNN